MSAAGLPEFIFGGNALAIIAKRPVKYKRMTAPSTEYISWLTDLKSRIQSAQIKAALRVNTELLLLYWDLGREILEKEKTAAWGDKLIPQLSKDLLKAFPEMKGFSRSNLYYVKQWCLFYGAADFPIVQQVVGQLGKGSQTVHNQAVEISPQVVGQSPEGVESKATVIVQQVVAQLPAHFFQVPWGHHIQVISKCKDPEEALFYITETARNNWSRNVLLHHIESKLYQRQGKAINNFEATLPVAQSDLARELLKDPYIRD